MFCRRCSIPHGASTLSSLNPQPPPAAPAHRLRAATWMNGRTAFGAGLVLLAVLAGPLFLAVCFRFWQVGVRHYQSTGS